VNQPLRIAFLLGSFPVVSETFILRQITGLLDLGHDVRIFANTRPDDAAPVHAEVAKYDLLNRTTYVVGPAESVVWELSVWPLSGQTWPPGATKSIANWRRLAHAFPKLLRCAFSAPGLLREVLSVSEYRYRAASLSGVYRLATLCRATAGFDVLHAHFGPVGNNFRFARELWNAPLVVSFHGYDFSTLPRKEGSKMYEKLFGVAGSVTVNSEFTRSCVEKLGCPGSKLRKLPVGLDLGEFSFSERVCLENEPVRLLTVARLVEIKGHEFALRAVAKAREKNPTLRHDIVGDGPLRGKLEQLIAELGLRDAVTLHGARDGTFVRGLMREAHLALLGSVSIEGDAEGQGLFLQEAQACGLPVIATQHGALPEGMLPGVSGFLVPERDVDTLAERLNFLVSQPELWPVLGRNGRAFVEARYDIRQLNRELTALYAAVNMDYHKSKIGSA
jgi:colanic acid/amylovoran biosynthesis glycosyltransferase